MRYLLFPALAVTLLTSCDPKPANESTEQILVATDTTTLQADTIKEDMHTSKNSLDWSGMYKGVLPCADCDGIETIIILNTDYTYLMQTKYLTKGEITPIEKTGTFSWNTAGNTIYFSDMENAPNQYFVAEYKLIQLDMTGKRIEGNLASKYILEKQ